MKKTIAILLLALTGCAITEVSNEHRTDVHCVLPVTRDAGMGVRVQGCAAWAVGPTKREQQKFSGK